MQQRPEYKSAQEEFYETTRPAWQWYMFVFKAKMIYATVIIGGAIIM